MRVNAATALGKRSEKEITAMPARLSRHLRAVSDNTRARNESTAAILQACQPARPVLNPAGALRLDQAELFLLSLDTEMLTADNLRAAYLLGLAELHLAGLIEIVRAVAQP